MIMPYMDAPGNASTDSMRFAAIYPASLVDLMTRAMMSSAPCFLITTPVYYYPGTLQAVTETVYRFLISAMQTQWYIFAVSFLWVKS